MTPETDIATKLQSSGHGTVGTTIFDGPVRPVGAGIPTAAIFVEPIGGRAPQDTFGSGQSVWTPQVRVLVRGATGDDESALTKARACLTSLHNATVTGYIRCAVDQSEPYDVSLPDERDRSVYAFTLSLWRQQ